MSQHPPIDLLGVKEAAAEIGVSVPNLKPHDEVTKQGIRGLPEPVAGPESGCSSGRVWYGPDIRAFAKLYKRTRARGPRNVDGGIPDGEQAAA